MEYSENQKGSFVWVSPYSPDDARGGWKAMQYHLLRALEAKLGRAIRCAPVEVPEDVVRKWGSRLLKILKVPRPYAWYSEKRLRRYAAAMELQLRTHHKLPVVFFGSLPFIRCAPTQPYYIFNDGAFFIHYWEYNNDHTHSREEIDRICRAEADFMRNAVSVWCSSQWVANRIAREYKLPKGKAICVGTGPSDVPTPKLPLQYEKTVVMISADFERKQGRLAVESVKYARANGLDLRIQFIGAKPPEDIMLLPFVEWCGWLNLRTMPDREKFSEVMSRAGIHMLLSKADLTPLAIAEASTYSKATLATRVGGISEMIIDGETGWLVEALSSPSAIGARLRAIFENTTCLPVTGRAAAEFQKTQWSWESVSSKACATLDLTHGMLDFGRKEESLRAPRVFNVSGDRG